MFSSEWVKEYSDDCVDTKGLQKEIDKYMEEYDARIQKVGKNRKCLIFLSKKNG